MQTKIIYKLLFLFPFIGNVIVYSQDLPKNRGVKSNLKEKVISIKKDSIKTDSVAFKTKKERLDAKVLDKAKDYKETDFKTKIATLYNEAELHYKDIELKAGIITINYNTNVAFARGIKDSLGNYIQRPSFKQGTQESEQDSLKYNFKNGKAVIYNVDTQQDDMLIHAGMTKRENDSTVYMNKAEITTSKKKKRDYHIVVNNIKVVPDKKVVGGLSQLYIADVPTPVMFPFFYVPLTKGRVSGFLLPTWGDNNQGYFLQNGGFYFAINDYVDLALTGDIYTNGSWGLRTNSSYKVRYKYSGRFSFRMENIINGQRGLSTYSKSNNFNISWSHSQDAKASPNSKFSASVNFGTSKYYRQSLNELNTPSFLNNNLSSSISYYRNFLNSPFSMNIALTHSQNTNSEVINMSLPNLSLNMDRIYPFAGKNGAKNNAVQRIGMTYSMNVQNQIVTNDDDFLKAGMFKDAKSGAQHNISLSTNVKALKYITLSPSVSYKDIWYLKTINKKWDDTNNEIITDTINGFDSFRTYSGGVSASTTIYGMFNFKKGKIKAIRHTMKPSISYNYAPDFSNYYEEVQANANGTTEEFTRFQGGIFGTPTKSVSQNLSFALRNLFEAKVASKDSTEVKDKKITLLNNLDFSASYNLEADSLKWSPMRIAASTKLFDNLNLNLNATLDPYALNASGNKMNTFNINNGGSLFRLTDAGLTASFNLSDAIFSKDKKKDGKKENVGEDENQFGDDLKNSNARNNKGNKREEDKKKKITLFESKIPWKLSLNYNIGYSNFKREDEISRNTLRFNGLLELTPKWDVTVSSGYDFKGKGLSYTRLGFARDLDSWRMNFSWTPFGNNSTYYFFIGVKSSVLSDLKYDQRKVPDKSLY